MEGQIKCFPDKVKEFIIAKLLLYEMLKGLVLIKDQSMNIKMARNSQLSTTESKKQTKETSRTETEA